MVTKAMRKAVAVATPTIREMVADAVAMPVETAMLAATMEGVGGDPDPESMRLACKARRSSAVRCGRTSFRQRVRKGAEADIRGCVTDVHYVPCVDGSVLSRDLTDVALLVGAAMCSACQCGASSGRWP